MFIAGVKKPKVKKIEIVGGRYNDSYGNTYHKSAVYVNDEIVGTSPETYGYGDQYVQTGMELLVKKGYFPRILKKVGEIWKLRSALKDRGVKIITRKKDFKLKRDFKRFEGD